MTEDDKATFASTMARLCIALREHDPDVVQLRTYFEALRDCEIELVIAAAEQLVKTATYFPRTSEWRTAVQTIRRERVEAQRELLRRAPRAMCETCGDSGWKPIEGNRVERCPCRVDRSLEVLGHRALPALPAPEPPPDPSQFEQIQAMVKPAIKPMPRVSRSAIDGTFIRKEQE